MSGATALNVALDDLASKFSLLAAKFSISAITWKKGQKKDSFNWVYGLR